MYGKVLAVKARRVVVVYGLDRCGKRPRVSPDMLSRNQEFLDGLRGGKGKLLTKSMYTLTVDVNRFQVRNDRRCPWLDIL